MLLGGEQGKMYPVAEPKEEAPKKPFKLPPKNQDMRRVYAYLIKQRGIDREVVTHFAKAGTLYENAEYHNCVFVGTDETGKSVHAHKRSTNSFGKAFRINIESSDPDYSFHHLGENDRLFVFEAPIDMLSYISLYPDKWRRHSYVACCGTSFLPVEKMLERLPQVGQGFLCLDNDEAGHKAGRRMGGLLREKGICSERFLPDNKDWNDDLITQKRQEQEGQNLCQAFGS